MNKFYKIKLISLVLIISFSVLLIAITPFFSINAYKQSSIRLETNKQIESINNSDEPQLIFCDNADGLNPFLFEYDLVNIEIVNNGAYGISITFSENAMIILNNKASELFEQQLYIFINNMLFSSPSVNQPYFDNPTTIYGGIENYNQAYNFANKLIKASKTVQIHQLNETTNKQLKQYPITLYSIVLAISITFLISNIIVYINYRKRPV